MLCFLRLFTHYVRKYDVLFINMSTFCKFFVNTSFNLMTVSAVPVFNTTCQFMFLAQVAERRKKVSSRRTYRSDESVVVVSHPFVINHQFLRE
jgi:hypothetical protein